MSRFSRRSATLSVSLISLMIVVSCGTKSQAESDISTVVGRGGTLFDSRVQVLNALPNLVDGTTCLYLSEYTKSNAPLFSRDETLTSQQQEFLKQAEREAKPVTLYPISMTELDRGLGQKEHERRTRGLLLVPAGIAAAYLGFMPIALGLAWTGSAGAVFGNVFAYPFISGILGGLGLINQATRDLSTKNYGLRVNDAVANSSEAPARSNLGVTLAFINVARSLPAAANKACPRNLTAESVQPYFQSITEQYNTLSDLDRKKASQNALAQLKNTEGCHFSAHVGDEKLIYHALPINDDSSAVLLQTYSLKPSVGAQLISDEVLKLQLKSDAGAGSKYIADNERGSIALWMTSQSNGKPVEAKLAHKLPTGDYVGQQTQLTGTCRL